ncbi:uncharacterized protein LOC131943823 [Physella acuta]|uniref:uncharacterized protein LOC131943823 n=1 Tax=Physella acuta TaxID=109671 RepID=UPI0027DAF888|nr:uncharacterized protein LOC131943823 [Physella acuta]
MEKVFAFLTLFLCIACLPEKIVSSIYNATIEGFERDCEANNCRYTGRILASLSVKGWAETNSGPRLMVALGYCYGDKNEVSSCLSEGADPGLCMLTIYPCSSDGEVGPCLTECNEIGENQSKFTFYPFVL